MIEALRIANWVIVEEAELELGPGLNVLTGETGTGKSIVLGALSLLAGGRGSGDAVRTGADRAVLEAELSTHAWPEVEEALARREIPQDGHGVAVQRTLTRGREGASGRSRVRVSGELLPASALAELLGDRIEISSQHSSQVLLRAETQLRLLDESGGLVALREEVAAEVAVLRSLARELEELESAAEERARRLDFLRFQVEEIDAVALREGELEDLEAEHARLAHADRIGAEGREASAALVGDGEVGAEVPNAVDRVSEAARRIEALAGLDPALGELAERLRGQESELFDAARDLDRYLARVDTDPARLAAVEERLGAVQKLQRKYGSTQAEIAASREAFASELAGLSGADARIEGLRAEQAERRAGLEERAAKLGRERAKAGKKLAKRVEAALEALAMAGARFEVSLETVRPPDGLPCGPVGAERAEFLFSANRGEAPRPLREVASGGELSRVFLAVRNALRRSGAGMVLVFDEVDAGIGGRVAERVGRALAELARHHQVLCITHLPQIAALGDVHFRVRKTERKAQTLAQVERIEGAERVEEIARMAGGESVTDATRRHAAELLGARSPTASA